MNGHDPTHKNIILKTNLKIGILYMFLLLQVLRYQRGGAPLLVSDEDMSSDIPACKCGAPRHFEFQVSHAFFNTAEIWTWISNYTIVFCGIGFNQS